jgi:hypothetical protein
MPNPSTSTLTKPQTLTYHLSKAIAVGEADGQLVRERLTQRRLAGARWPYVCV